MSLRIGANSFRLDMNAARMVLSIGSPALPRQYSMRCFAKAKHLSGVTTPRGAVAPERRRGLQVEGRGHGREGGRLPQRGQAEQLLGGAEQGVEVEQRRRPRAGPGAGADHDGGDVAADVGLVGGARGGGPAFSLVPGDEHRGPLVYSGLCKIAGRLASSHLSPSATVPSCMSSIRFGVTKENAGSLPADRSLASRG